MELIFEIRFEYVRLLNFLFSFSFFRILFSSLGHRAIIAAYFLHETERFSSLPDDKCY